MRSLSQIAIWLILSVSLAAQSPHGKELTIACADCHNPKGWKLEEGTYSFRHASTRFPLTGMHNEVDCRQCHPSLVFSEAETSCFSCHTDMHEQTVGMECERCHTTSSWLVNNITDIHRQSRFPLTGAHLAADCYSCHPSASQLKFELLGVDCYDCHKTDFITAVNPNHVEGAFSTNCIDCHNINAFSWSGSGFNHSFFPLTKGHAINDCKQCHTGPDYSGLSTYCYSCHATDYTAAVNPSHVSSGFSTNCLDCHSTEPDWKPAQFLQHDGLYFPIYSGSHNGEWENCTDCHTDPNNFATNSCIVCHDHNQSDMDEEHNEVSGYIYTSAACLECHPTGDAEGAFNHNASAFPLTGAHLTTDCLDCHASGYAGTTTICFDCHQDAFNQSTNPNHVSAGIPNACADCHTTEPDWIPATFAIHDNYYPLTGGHATIADDCNACHAGDYVNTPVICFGCHETIYNQTTNPSHVALDIPNDCASCHTTNPDWSPASFPIHNDYYVLAGAHALISNDCAVCHNGDYNSTPNTCFGCHADDYNQTTDPPHQSVQFPTDCESCHTQSAWEPSTFNHDGQYFPIYSGSHEGEWDQCSDCHTNPSNYAIFTCLPCHPQPETDEDHQGIPGYMYESTACLACHPDGSGAGGFNHNNTAFPLTGAHLTVDCISCHENGYSGTSTICFDCHEDQYDQSVNPNHIALGIPNDCATCHTTNPDWTPATFAIHNEYYVLQGAHAAIANDCAACHNGDYVNTPNTCFGCHEEDYNQTTDPPHLSVQFPTDCESCHTQTSWVPSTFNHDGQYFPIYSGSHEGAWDQCSDCHTNPGNYAIFTCLPCHPQAEMDDNHNEVPGYQYNSDACLACHPDGSGSGAFNHSSTGFPLTGAHATVGCDECHINGYSGTSTICSDCHSDNYNQATNPDHVGLGIPNTCEVCHTTNPDWMPATFPIHDNYYPLTGGHALVAGDCIGCHNGNYNNTSTVCFDCHISDYNQSTNPNHLALNIPNICATCHTTNPDWMPATFSIHNEYYVLQGAHASIANDCAACHNGNYNNTPNTCYGCHADDYNQTTDPPHQSAQFPTDCESCHTQTTWEPSTFNHDGQYFPIYSGAHNGNWDQCSDCHTNPSNYAVFTCLTCHEQSQTNNDHSEVTGYQYNSDACLACHPDGNASGAFNHSSTGFSLTGAHANVGCAECHESGYSGTSTVCFDCHSDNYNQAANPNHVALGIPNDCATCHTTNPDWTPATFGIHDQYYVLAGAHLAIANECVICHNGNYLNTPNTCYGCHVGDYNQTSNPPHQSAQFPTDCEVCHSQTVWDPSTFNHDQQYFEIYTGGHEGEWDQCSDCHTNPNNYAIFTCLTCHTQSQTNNDHDEVTGYQYNSDACLACHPNGNKGAIRGIREF
jgi:mRNA-degrading endonuclease YafQ of YafQ-DinJ toxin-antitoxin module